MGFCNGGPGLRCNKCYLQDLTEDKNISTKLKNMLVIHC